MFCSLALVSCERRGQVCVFRCQSPLPHVMPSDLRQLPELDAFAALVIATKTNEGELGGLWLSGFNLGRQSAGSNGLLSQRDFPLGDFSLAQYLGLTYAQIFPSFVE